MVSDPGGDTEHFPLHVQVCCLPENPTCRLSQALVTLSTSLSNDHNYTFFGAQYIPCILDPSGFGLPLLGWPSDFTTALLDQL